MSEPVTHYLFRAQCLTRPVPNCRGRSGFWLVPENFCVFLPNQKPERRRPFGTGLVRHWARSIQPKLPEISVQPEKFRKNGSTFWGGPIFPVGPVVILVEWITPIVPRGSSRRSFLFFVPYFPARLVFLSLPLSALGSPRMNFTVPSLFPELLPQARFRSIFPVLG